MDARVRAFLIFDQLHDADLRDALVAQSRRPEAIFTVVAESEAALLGPDGEERLRAQLQGADEVIVMCGQHTEASAEVAAEFRVVLEEHKPYVLLWGRRELMCTKPPGAKAGEGMYSWTATILEERIQEARRLTRVRDAASRREARSAKQPAA